MLQEVCQLAFGHPSPRPAVFADLMLVSDAADVVQDGLMRGKIGDDSPPGAFGQILFRNRIQRRSVPQEREHGGRDPLRERERMREQQVERRLAANFAADVFGYSRLMEAREERTIAAMMGQRPEVYGSGSRRILAAALAQLGDTDKVRQEGALFIAMTPRFTISKWLAMHAFGDGETLAHYADGCRKAGLPE